MKKILTLMLAVSMLLGIILLPAGAAGNSFPDVHDADWFRDYVAYAAEHHIMNGDGTNFNPNDCTTREEFAQIMYNIFATDEEKAMAKAGKYENNFTDVKPGAWYAPVLPL